MPISAYDEQAIYDHITDSAKTKFDYKSFEKSFLEQGLDASAVDKLLWLILDGCASGEDRRVVTAKINGNLMQLGLMIRKEDFDSWVDEIASKLEDEILAIQSCAEWMDNDESLKTIIDGVRIILGD